MTFKLVTNKQIYTKLILGVARILQNVPYVLFSLLLYIACKYLKQINTKKYIQ